MLASMALLEHITPFYYCVLTVQQMQMFVHSPGNPNGWKTQGQADIMAALRKESQYEKATEGGDGRG